MYCEGKVAPVCVFAFRFTQLMLADIHAHMHVRTESLLDVVIILFHMF